MKDIYFLFYERYTANGASTTRILGDDVYQCGVRSNPFCATRAVGRGREHMFISPEQPYDVYSEKRRTVPCK